MTYYITFNDQPSGIYSSQVIDTVSHLREEFNVDIKLIAFFPLNNFKQNKLKVKKFEKSAFVVPMVFGISRWRWHRFILRFITKRKASAVCRGSLATELALNSFSRVIYDGRAAVKAEVEEYDVIGGNDQLGRDFVNSEIKAVIESDFRIAVSNKLVEYWKSELNYKGKDYVVIPCTLNSDLSKKVESIQKQTQNVKVVYSGGTGAWQSFEKVVQMFRVALMSQSDLSVLFLTKQNEFITELENEFPQRCERKYVDHTKVSSELSLCDYGILIRENKVTNQVASPVKFAEYLNSGLKVLISDNIGDFTEVVSLEDCGIVIKDEIPILKKNTNRMDMIEVCDRLYNKSSSSNQLSFQKLKENL